MSVMEDNPYHAPSIPAEANRSTEPTGFFVQRRVVDGEEEVRLPYVALYWWVRFPLLAALVWVMLDSNRQWMPLMVAIWVAFLALGFPYWFINSEIKRRMKSQPVSLQGSRYSFSNPITYRWKLPG